VTYRPPGAVSFANIPVPPLTTRRRTGVLHDLMASLMRESDEGMWYESGTAVLRSNSTAAPATVSGERLPYATDVCPLGQVGKAARCFDPRARRPAIPLITCRAGCLGDGRVTRL
jgi:hypothetical protein